MPQRHEDMFAPPLGESFSVSSLGFVLAQSLGGPPLINEERIA